MNWLLPLLSTTTCGVEGPERKPSWTSLSRDNTGGEQLRAGWLGSRRGSEGLRWTDKGHNGLESSPQKAELEICHRGSKGLEPTWKQSQAMDLVWTYYLGRPNGPFMNKQWHRQTGKGVTTLQWVLLIHSFWCMEWRMVGDSPHTTPVPKSCVAVLGPVN